MLFPEGSVTLHAESSTPKPAFLVRFPEDAWNSLEAAARAGGRVEISLDGSMSLILPDSEPLTLEARTIGNSTEIHHLSSSSSSSSSLAIRPIAQAFTRLSVPISSNLTARAADKLRQQNEAHDKERKERAERVNGVATASSIKPVKSNGNGLAKKVGSKLLNNVGAMAMGRSYSSPSVSAGTGSDSTHTANRVTTGAGGASSGANAAASTSAAPIIPLKTRVVQLLALGPTSASEIVKRVGGAEQDVMRVVKVVGKCLSPSPLTYTLDPSQYSKIKIGNWKYTYAEKKRVIECARAAFDELGLDPEAEERLELDRKESEAMSSHTAGSGSASGSASGSGSGAGSSGESTGSEGSIQPFTPHASGLTIPGPTPFANASSNTQSNIEARGSRHGSPIHPSPSPRKPVSKGSATGASGSVKPRNTNVDNPNKGEGEPSKKSTGKEKEKEGRKDKPSQTLIGKQMAKFRAESAKRSSSLPNTKNEGTSATIPKSRGGTPNVESASSSLTKSRGGTPNVDHSSHSLGVDKEAKKRKREREKEAASKAKGRRNSRDYTSSEGSDSDGDDDAKSSRKEKKSKVDKKEKEEESRGRGRVVKVARGRDEGKSEVSPGSASGIGRPSRNGEAIERKSTTAESRATTSTTGSRRTKESTSSEESSSRPTSKLPSPETSQRSTSLSAAPAPRARSSILNGQPQAPLTHGLPPRPVASLGPIPKRDTSLTSTPIASQNDHDSRSAPPGTPSKDPEEMRERYEELSPAYQLLTQKLAGIYQACEDIGSGVTNGSSEGTGGVSQEELGKLVKRWEKWHRELEGIRRWFGGSSA